MAGADELHRMALALAGTVAAPHFDRTAYKVWRTYVTLATDGLSANFKFTPEEQEFKCLLAPECFVPVPGGWGPQGWTCATLGAMREAELKAALALAHAHAVAKKVRR